MEFKTRSEEFLSGSRHQKKCISTSAIEVFNASDDSEKNYDTNATDTFDREFEQSASGLVTDFLPENS